MYYVLILSFLVNNGLQLTPVMTASIRLEKVVIALCILDDQPACCGIDKLHAYQYLGVCLCWYESGGLEGMPGETTSAGMNDGVLALSVEPEAPAFLGIEEAVERNSGDGG